MAFLNSIYKSFELYMSNAFDKIIYKSDTETYTWGKFL